ncbi:PREDICTED: high affinity immunoglobulin alpha and immunoglobulin mu Fc receptor [Chrysochloris asiatica]|uniref:high affinity immunoglobulin alpha and immunoglobulin mu Fc receptor n=1 Tax=Chrysochloris asiatica TaxID=185453 RepID=UPI0003F12A84|nr:PREDICTED: high affinity immunoglobulin alpha and immunoglobulin mu Fc receptor [Chrysochloris asiatica]
MEAEMKQLMQVTNQRPGWKMPLLIILVLLQAVDALKGPRLVSGKLGGTVTIKCRYAPTSVNRHQRKYWCRLGPPKWICRTIVSTNHYTHHRYHGRVALEDFPWRSLFVLTMSQLSQTDEGYYRCGIGNRNDMLFFPVNLTVSAGPSSTIPTNLDPSTPTMSSLATVSSVANRLTPGTIETIDGVTGKDRVASTPGTSKTTVSTKGRQGQEITKAVAPGTGSWIEGSIRATIHSPEKASAEEGLMSTAGDSNIQAKSNQAPAAGPLRPQGKESSMKSASSKQKSVSRILTPVCTVLSLVLILALVILKKKLWKKTSQEAERTTRVTLIQMTSIMESNLSPDQLPHLERKTL